jgi:hypothetical protein
MTTPDLVTQRDFYKMPIRCVYQDKNCAKAKGALKLERSEIVGTHTQKPASEVPPTGIDPRRPYAEIE